MEWGDEQEKLLKFMIHGQSESDQDLTTLDLLGGGSCSSSSSITSGPGSRSLDLVLDMDLPPPPGGWEKRLDLKNGQFYYVHLSSGTSSYHHPGNPQASNLLRELERMTTRPRPLGLDGLELRLGNSSSNMNGLSSIQTVKKALEASSIWKLQQMPGRGKLERPASSSCDFSSRCSSSESSSSSSGNGNHVLLTSCRRCFMYVMIHLVNPTCPKCSKRLVMDDDLHLRQVKKPRTARRA